LRIQYCAYMTERRYTAREWAAVLAVWTGLAGLSTLQTALYLQQRGEPIQWFPLVTSRLVDWYTCLAFAPVVLWLIRRSVPGRGHRLQQAGLIVAAALVFLPVKYAVLIPVLRWVQPAQRPTTVGAAVATNFFTEMLFLAGIALAVYTVELYRRVQDEQIERTRLGRELAEARLDALTLQLQPHFLFNTLNSVVSLIRRSPRAAEDMVTDLSEMLQETLRARGHEVALSAELELVELYLRIMRHRFGDRLAARIEADATARRALVPRFLLQPIVENAIEHGFGARDGTGRLVIAAAVHDSRLEIGVMDNGPGFSAAHSPRKPNGGIGVANTRRRLDEMYGGDYDLIISPAEGGTTVTIIIPHRTGEADL
jgi:two-component system, LytTR family, sensor kinase